MSKLNDLIALASEPSSAKRRELLRGVTDLFFSGEGFPPTDLALFGDVMTQLASEMEEAVRAELAVRMAPHPAPPIKLIRKLARDTIAVAGPVLSQSPVLTEDDLLEVARTEGQDHLRALSRRSTVSAALSDAIVERGDDQTLGVLVRNEGAALSREAHETVVDRAAANPDLHEAVVERRELPADLLNEMYFVVESRLREQIMARNAELDPAELEEALSISRNRLATQDGALPSDYAQADAAVKAMRRAGGIGAKALAAMLRGRETTKFLIALGDLADIDFHTARRIIDRRELDALAIVCKAADLDRALFITFAVLMLDRDADAMGLARKYGDLYAELPRDAALRTIRFWRVRRQTGDIAA